VSGLIKYPEERAVEDAAFGLGLTPTRLCRVLLPVWRADARATIYDSEPYDLIDRYLEAGIARGGLGSVAELSEFYGLDLAVMGSAARFLESIGHLSRDDGGRLALSDIGLQSVREGKRYTRVLEDRRYLYFDGFTRQPLTRAFYDDRAVTFLDRAALAQLLAETGIGPGPSPARGAFTPVAPIPPVGLGPEALSALARLPPVERDRFNLPEQVISPSLAGDPEQVFLPAYVVRAIDAGGGLAYLAYTQASQEADPEWSQVCAAAEEVAALVENEYQSGRDEGEEDAARRWVEKRFTGRFDLGWRDGLLVATLAASAFAGTGPDGLEPRRIGSLIKMNGWYFRVWCDDDRLRRRALLDLADTYLGARAKTAPDAAAKRLARFCRQVGFSPLPPAELAKLARTAGRKTLAAQLDKLGELSGRGPPGPRRAKGRSIGLADLGTPLLTWVVIQEPVGAASTRVASRDVIPPSAAGVSADLAGAALGSPALARAYKLARWLGPGRKLTSDGVLRPGVVTEACWGSRRPARNCPARPTWRSSCRTGRRRSTPGSSSSTAAAHAPRPT
jgi:hypothetical protein